MAQSYPTDPDFGQYDFTEPQYQDPLSGQGYYSNVVDEAKLQRQKWQARLLRENPDDMDLFANQERARLEEEGGGPTHAFQTPGERDAELEQILNDYFRK